MSNAENKPEVQPSHAPEPQPLTVPVALTDGNYTISAAPVKRKDGDGISLRIQRGETVLHAVRVFPGTDEQGNKVDYVQTGHSLPREIFPGSSEGSQASLTPLNPTVTSETQTHKETERPKPVKLWGNLSKILKQIDQRVTFLFAEHPTQDAGCQEQNQSFYHTLTPEEQKNYRYVNNTVFHTMSATHDRIALVENAATTDKSVLTCYPHTWEEQEEGGRKKTIRGFVLLNWEPQENYGAKTNGKRRRSGKSNQVPTDQKPLL
jgi:hypothetical protein